MYILFIHSNSTNTYLPEINWNLNSINLVHGKDTVKKTLLLKAMYACVKAQETHNRGNRIKTTYSKHLWETFGGSLEKRFVQRAMQKVLGRRLTINQQHAKISS